MHVSGLPVESGFQQFCDLSGSGRWSVFSDEEQSRIRLSILTSEGNAACEPGVYDELAIAGRRMPYRLYWPVSDPDLGTGVWLASNR